MTTQDKIEGILENYRKQYIGADLGTLNDDVQAIEADNAKERAKAAIEKLILGARLDEMTNLRGILKDHITSNPIKEWKTAMGFVNEKIATLKAKLGDK